MTRPKRGARTSSLDKEKCKMVAKRKRKETGGQHVGQRIAALRSDIGAIQDDMKGLAAGVGEVALEQADGAKSYVNGAVSDAQSYAQARLNKALKDAEKMVDRLSDEVEGWTNENVEGARETIRNQPLAACVMAMGAGALIGALLLRR
jgi:ElaB/YqjD/DUF883 family membrane-anchored ribosome-binding protein